MVKYDSPTEGQKWMISFWSGLLFFIISSPFAYIFTRAFFEKIGFQTSINGCPLFIGLIIHAIVFAILIRVMMIITLPGTYKKEKYRHGISSNKNNLTH